MVPFPWCLLFRPASIAGWFRMLLALAFSAQVFIAGGRCAHSASDTLYGIFPFRAPTFLALAWIAGSTGDRRPSLDFASPRNGVEPGLDRASNEIHTGTAAREPFPIELDFYFDGNG